MSSTFRSVNRSNPCPICGKPDWCFYIPMSKYDGELLCCQRHTSKEDVIGRDGNFYIHVKFSEGENSKGSSIFEEANQRKARLDNEAHDFSRANAAVDHERVLTPVNIIHAKEPKELDRIYRKMQELLKLEPMHREYLHKEGWTDELIEKYKIVSFPEKDYIRYNHRRDTFKTGNLSRKKLASKLMEEFGPNALIGVPGAYKDKGDNWTFSGASGILFPQYNVNHLLYRVRLRRDFRDVDAVIFSIPGGDDYYIDEHGEKTHLSMKGRYTVSSDGKRDYRKDGGKYRNFSSFRKSDVAAKQGFYKNLYNSGCESGNALGFYFCEQKDDMYLCYITEGEKKGIFSNEILRAPFISVPGVNAWGLLLAYDKSLGKRPIDVLREKGIKMLVIAYDADKEENARVMAAQQSVVEALKKEGFMIGIAEWDMAQGKGIDDLLARGGKPHYILAP